VYEKSVLRKIIKPKQEGIKSGQKHHKLYSSEDISRLMHWGHTACTTELENAKLCRIIIDGAEKGPLKSLE
jgi:hypothetical protein